MKTLSRLIGSLFAWLLIVQVNAQIFDFSPAQPKILPKRTVFLEVSDNSLPKTGLELRSDGAEDVRVEFLSEIFEVSLEEPRVALDKKFGNSLDVQNDESGTSDSTDLFSAEQMTFNFSSLEKDVKIKSLKIIDEEGNLLKIKDDEFTLNGYELSPNGKLSTVWFTYDGADYIGSLSEGNKFDFTPVVPEPTVTAFVVALALCAFAIYRRYRRNRAE